MQLWSSPSQYSPWFLSTFMEVGLQAIIMYTISNIKSLVSTSESDYLFCSNLRSHAPNPPPNSEASLICTSCNFLSRVSSVVSRYWGDRQPPLLIRSQTLMSRISRESRLMVIHETFVAFRGHWMIRLGKQTETLTRSWEKLAWNNKLNHIHVSCCHRQCNGK